MFLSVKQNLEHIGNLGGSLISPLSIMFVGLFGSYKFPQRSHFVTCICRSPLQMVLIQSVRRLAIRSSAVPALLWRRVCLPVGAKLRGQ